MAWYKYFHVEIPVLLCFFSQLLLSSVATNLLVYRTCYALLGYNESDCNQLGNEDNDITAELEPLVQPSVNRIQMVINVSEAAIPAFICMFLGTWSDKFGRKPFLIISLMGITLTTLFNTVISCYPKLSPWFFVVSSLPASFTGGSASMFIMSSVYLMDVSTSETRALRLGVYEALMGFGALLGLLIAPQLLYATSYTAVYAIATLLMGLSIAYTIFIIPESLDVESKVPIFTELKKITNVNKLLRPSFKKRPQNGRYFIWTLVGILMLHTGYVAADKSLRTLFLRGKLHWTLTEINYGMSYGSVLYIVGTMFGTMYLYQKRKIKEMPMIISSASMSAAGYLVMGLAEEDYHVYIAYTLSCFLGIIGSMSRTLTSYIVEPHELGSVIAVTSIFDTLAKALASVIFPTIYNATIDKNSAVYNYVNMGMCMIIILIVLNLMRYDLPVYEEKLNEIENQNSDRVNSASKTKF